MSGRIPREFIQQLLERIELVDLIDARVPLRKKTGSNFFACCPFHNEKSASFSVSQTKQFYYCFGCGAHGNALDFLIQFDRLEFPEAVETLARQIGVDVPRESQTSVVEKSAKHPHLFDLLENITRFYQTQLRQNERAIQYLKSRGISGEIAKQFGIGFAPLGWDHLLQSFGRNPTEKQQLLEAGMIIKKEDGKYYDRFRDRIMFPIHDKRGRVIGFGGRILDQGEPKYLNSPETTLFQKGHELYGLYHVLHAARQLDRIVIVEGYMDVIALFQHGVTNAVATLGTATTAHHLQRLFRYTSEIVFCFDGDNAGRTAAWRALQVILPIMQDGIQVRYMFLPEKEDPDSIIRQEGKEGFLRRVQDTSTLEDFLFQQLAAQADLNSVDGRARFVKLAMEHINQLQPGVFQKMMLDELAKRARVSVASLKPASRETVTTEKARPPSAVRLALALLIQQPELAQDLTEPLPQLELPGFDLLLSILSHLKNEPTANTGLLLEYWRDKPEGKWIAQLGHWEHSIPHSGIKNEFLGAIKQLSKLSHQQKIDGMLAKANITPLSTEEKQQLQQLIHEKNH